MGKSGTHTDDETRLEIARALCGQMQDDDGSKLTAARIAQIFGAHQRTVYKIRDDLLRAGLQKMAEAKPVAPVEVHDAEFWRKRAKTLEKEQGARDRIIRELGVLDGLQVGHLDWAAPVDDPGESRATLIVHNSDRHMGEVVDPREINGWNEFGPDICRRRVKRFMDAACIVGRRWGADTTIDGVLYTMGGDETSGDIHDELKETNALTSPQQVEAAAELHVACLEQLVEEYGRVHVMAVPGNHGRTTKKPTAKRYGALSYDTMVARMVARELRGDDRITFDVADGPDLMAVIYGWRILLTHGDKIGTGGGQGFAGPVLPIIRGVKKVQAAYSLADQSPDLVLMGHYHTSAAPPGILANGSVVGFSEYGMQIRGGNETPRQWLGMLRQNWGLAERLDVQLEKPLAREKPRVRAS